MKPWPTAPILIATSVLGLAACGDDTTAARQGAGGAGGAGSGSSSTTGPVTNECGTFDSSEPGDGVMPDDPASEPIVRACEALCAHLTTGGCDDATCLDDCRLRSCGMCPGKLVPITECEVANVDVATACSCADGSIACDDPPACSALYETSTHCGG